MSLFVQLQSIFYFFYFFSLYGMSTMKGPNFHHKCIVYICIVQLEAIKPVEHLLTNQSQEFNIYLFIFFYCNIFHFLIEAGDQHQPPPATSPKLEPVERLKTEKASVTKEIDTQISDPGRPERKEDQREKISVETRPKRTHGDTSRNFEIRSFDQALETSKQHWEIHQVGNDEESSEAQALQANVVRNSNNRSETEVTNKQNNPTSEMQIKSGFGFKNEIQSPIPKKRSGEGIRVMPITHERTTLSKKNDLRVDLKAKEDPGLSEGLKKHPVNNVNTPEHDDLDQSLVPVQKVKERAVGELLVTDFKRSTPTKTKDLSVDLDLKGDPDLPEGPANNVNAPKHGSLDQSLDPVQKRKDQAIEELIVTDFKQRCPKGIEEIKIDFKLEKDSDILEGPVNNVNRPKSVNWDQKNFDIVQERKERAVEEVKVTDVKKRPQRSMEKLGANLDVERNPDFSVGPVKNVNTANWDQYDLDLEQNGKESAVEEIKVTGFKSRSPTKMEELTPELNVDADLDLDKDLKREAVYMDSHKGENRSEELPGSVMRSERKEAGGKNDFDGELSESESTNQKVSEEMGEIGEQEDESGISESSILASVYARATRPKSAASKTTFTEDPMQEAVEVIPTIVIVPSESEEPKEMERKCLQLPYFRRQILTVSLVLSRRVNSAPFPSFTPQEHALFAYILYITFPHPLVLNYCTVSNNPVEASLKRHTRYHELPLLIPYLFKRITISSVLLSQA